MSKLAGMFAAAVASLFLFSGHSAMAGDRHESRLIVKRMDRVHLDGRSADNRWNRDRRHGGDHGDYRRSVRRVANVVVVVNRGQWNGGRHYERNTYSGDVDITVRRNVGQWSYGTVSSSASDVVIPDVPNSKVIDVKALKPNAACSMEAGVCVIRP